MRKAALLWLAIAFAGGAAGPAAARSPVVVELYTSQGCSSCAGSGQVIADLADKPHVLALTFGVDYWDYLGWRDTFAKPEFVERQRAYMSRFALREVYTPQLVVDGRLQAAALPADKAEKLVRDAARAPHDPPDIAFSGTSRVAVGTGRAPRGGADVWLVRYDPHDQSVAVKSGETRGQTVVEHNVVRQLVRLGGWAGRPKSYRIPPAEADGLDTVVIVQGAHGGRIIAAKGD
ncbi:MAG: DUF1223 domain-containing protein [Caulobacteraceae bacterium]|nr:DUF1223 domain-containing protein [Caulobacteraceae bacterium]